MFQRHKIHEQRNLVGKISLVIFDACAWFLMACFLVLAMLAFYYQFDRWYYLLGIAILVCPETPLHPLFKVFSISLILVLVNYLR
ncbi:hypothetical protein NIES4075_66840 [Tolypothrix sp. NIES-4075]|uniref:hypothetical protein n=1 Tax=Tolypothrix sp. NIES-4075 TaxID=2005459 RepID=UPI000B5C32C2|nr:hypothetical protein [Tolypothrix sp. NIES-4075]GAX45663.1 hypothetical protein NIES4075_66840 [Tolypothrix sp. NIES-4075]